MECTSTNLPYGQTGFFSKIVVDYIDQAPLLKSFYQYPVSQEGLAASVGARKQFPVNREVLVNELQKQYAQLPAHPEVQQNIDKLQHANTFSICTAHQPCIFTGSLFFVYKILHAIRLARHCKELMPENDFVPVYYMGSEDNDLSHVIEAEG